MTLKRSCKVGEVPLYLISHIVSWQIRKTGDILYRITVKRTNLHHYNIFVRTKTFRKELSPVDITMLPEDASQGIGRHIRRDRAGCTS